MVSVYDTSPLRETLLRLVDFDRINARLMRFSVGAVNVRTGNFAYFDTDTHRHRAGAHHRQRLAAARLPGDRDRRRILLGRRPRFQHAAAMGSRKPAAARHAGVPGRSVERARRTAAQPRRSRSAAQGDRLLEPHAGDDRPISSRCRSCASRSPICSRSFPKNCRTDEDVKILARESRREGLQHRPPHLPRRELRRHRQGLRILAPDHGGALGHRLRPCRSRTLNHPEVMQLPDQLEGVRTFDICREDRE